MCYLGKEASSQPQNQVERRLFRNIVVGEGSSVFQLLPCEIKPLLILWNALSVSDLRLHILD